MVLSVVTRSGARTGDDDIREEIATILEQLPEPIRQQVTPAYNAIRAATSLEQARNWLREFQNMGRAERVAAIAGAGVGLAQGDMERGYLAGRAAGQMIDERLPQNEGVRGAARHDNRYNHLNQHRAQTIEARQPANNMNAFFDNFIANAPGTFII
jgi:hypothetical protein